MLTAHFIERSGFKRIAEPDDETRMQERLRSSI